MSSEDIQEIRDYAEELENPEILDKNFYTIIAPESFRPNSDFKLNLTLHDSENELIDPCRVKISIRNEDDASKYNIEKEAMLEVNTTKELAIPIGDIPTECNYKLVAEGLSSIRFKHEACLNIECKNYSIMIQTDKKMYKANDIVRFRVLVLNPKLCPAQLTKEMLNIHVMDPKSNRVRQWNNAKLTCGVFEATFDLTDLPELGGWYITAEVGEEKKTQTIEVEEYVLPLFKVEIESQDEFTVKDEVVRAVISAKYTYGKPLKGKAIVSIKERNYGLRYYCVDDEDNSEKGQPLSSKTIDIDGRGSVEFSVENELSTSGVWLSEHFTFKAFDIIVEVKEDLTGLSQKAEKAFNVFKYPYKLTCDLTNEQYCAGKPISFTVAVRYRNGTPFPINNENNEIVITREQLLQINDDCTQEIKTTYKHKFSPEGELKLTWDIPEKEYNVTIKGTYDIETIDLGYFYPLRPKNDSNLPDKELKHLKTKLLTENPSVNKELEFEILSATPLKNYTYQLVVRGKILKCETVVLPENTSHTLKLKLPATYDLVPKAYLIVYFVEKARIIDSAVCIELHDNLANYVNLSLEPETTKPGELVNISVKSNPKSFIGLLGVDQSVLLLKSGNDLSMKEAFDELDYFNKYTKSQRNYYDYDTQKSNENIPSYFNEFGSFSDASTIIFTNTIKPAPKYELCCLQCEDSDMMFIGNSSEARVRKDFPETWIWESIPGDSFSGAVTIPKTVPDTITSWIVSGFAISPDSGLGLTKEAKKLTVFQPFFISLNLPFSVKRGEVVSVPCTVYNYTENDVETEVTLENQNNEFEFLDGEPAQGSARKNRINIKSNTGETVKFVIKLTHVGMVSLKVKAVSAIAGDTIIRILNVQPEGVPQFVNKAIFVDLREKNELELTSMKIDIPVRAISDSTRIQVSCVGDLLGGTIKNIRELIRLPCGCGEQNMLNFVPNIVILNYLRNTNQLTAETEAQIKKYTETGYQRELKYKHSDGSFSAFGKTDKHGSTWLTAFVAKSFQRASEHIYIDPKIIEEALDYLKGVQSEDGSFAEKGSMLCKEMQGGSCNHAALTAYVLTAFVEYKNNKYEEIVKKATKCLTDSLKSMDDIYTLAVVSYALQLLNSELKDEVLKKLLEKAKSKENQKWWEKPVDTHCFGCKQSKTIGVEMTSYALLTLLEAGQEIETLPILKWLLNQRNSQGGFEGTQDTVVGLEALSKIASKITTKGADVKINVKCPEQEIEQNFVVNKDNLLIMQTEKLPSTAQSVIVAAAGQGFALLELSYRYNIKDADPTAGFALKVTSKLETSAHLNLEINACFQPPKGSGQSIQSNMAVLEVSLPSGFLVNTSTLNKLPDQIDLIKKVETKDSETVAIIYFDHLTNEFLKINLDAILQFEVAEQKPSSIVIYDYYDNALSAREFYSLKPNEK